MWGAEPAASGWGGFDGPWELEFGASQGLVRVLISRDRRGGVWVLEKDRRLCREEELNLISRRVIN